MSEKLDFKLKIFGADGSETGEFPIEKSVIEMKKGDQSVHESVVAYLAEIRAGTASTKNRAEVRGGGAKPWRQKGTGRARAGSNRSPVWRHGGITFGPKPRSFARKMNKKTIGLALRRAFSERVAEGCAVVVDSIQLPDHKTKNIITLLKKLKLGENVLMVVKDFDEKLLRASSNIPDVMTVKASAVNAYQILRFEKILFTREAADEFIKRLQKKG